MFLRQVVLQQGIPFEMKLPKKAPLAYGSLTKEQFDAPHRHLIKSADFLHDPLRLPCCRFRHKQFICNILVYSVVPMGLFSGLFRARDAPQNRTSGSTYSFFMGTPPRSCRYQDGRTGPALCMALYEDWRSVPALSGVEFSTVYSSGFSP